MLLIWFTAHRQVYLLYWSFGFLFGAIGWVINLVPVNVFGSEALFWLIDIFITLISVSGVTYGLVIRSQRSWNIIWFVFAAFIALHWIVYFSSIQNDYALKMAISPWFIAICMQLNVYIVWQKSGALSAIEKIVAVICQVSALIHALRGILLVTQTSMAEQNMTSAYEIVSYLVLPANFTAIGIALLMLVIADVTERLKTGSIVDGPTHILNRRGIADISEKVMANCQRAKQPISLILIDIDLFDSIKQQYGSKTGQQALSAFTKTITEILRRGDFIGQLREERFILVLPNTDESETLKLAEKIRLAVGQISIQYRTENIRLTASLGVLSTQTTYCYHTLISNGVNAISLG
jgi:diguanylate cyclase (GGDEF)-like protein